MKLLAFSDVHLDAVTAGKSRREEVLTFLTNATVLVEKNDVDLVVFAGDAHDPGSFLDAMYAADLIRRFTAFPRLSKKPVFVAIAGNHDVVDTSELVLGSPVTSLTPLRVAVTCVDTQLAERMFIFDRPFTRKLSAHVAVLALPYVSRAHSAVLAGWEAHAFKVAREYIAEGLKLIVVGHRVIPGARMSSESIEMARGQDQLFPVEEVEKLNPALVINGHYHARQVVTLGSLSIQIPGSPVRFTFGEVDEIEKGVLLVEVM